MIQNENIKNDLRLSRIFDDATMAEALNGGILPEPVVYKIVDIAAKYPDYEFFCRRILDRKVRFFRDGTENFVFINQRGEEFSFSNEAYPIKHNQIFFGLKFFHREKTVCLYRHFYY